MRMEGLTAPWKWPIECSKLFRTSISTVSPGDEEEDEVRWTRGLVGD